VARGRRTRSSIAFGPQRKTVWVTTLITESVAAGGADIAGLLGNRTIADMEGLTLTRTIGRLYFQVAAVDGTFTLSRLDYGVGLVSQESFAAGVLPDPGVDFDKPISDWVYKDMALVTGSGDTTLPLEAPMHQWDVKSRRKIGDGELFFIVDNGNVVTGRIIIVEGIIRCLFLLP